METRAIKTELTADNNKLVGYAAVFNSETTITEGNRTFVERIAPGAFRNSLNRDIIATFNHNENNFLGRTSSGTLRVFEDNVGLRFEIDLPQFATELRELVARGDVRGASFAFSVNKGGETWNGSTRTLTDLTVYELGAVINPAYPQTAVGLRSNNELKKLRLVLAEKAAQH